jgi:hypothetical protein
LPSRAQERGDRDRQRRRDRRRRAVLRQRGKAHARAFDQRPAGCRRQPVAEPGKGEGAAGAELLADAFAREPVAGEAVPEQRDRAFKSVTRNKLADLVAAHPDDPALAIGVAEHGLRRDHPFEALAFKPCAFKPFAFKPFAFKPCAHVPRSFMSRAMADRSSDTPASRCAEVESTSG